MKVRVLLYVMDTNKFSVFKLFLFGILVNAWVTRTLSATGDPQSVEPVLPAPRGRGLCNESHLLWEIEVCGEGFKRDMAHVEPQHWCNLTYFLSEYHLFTHCTETRSERIDCYWPNPLAEGYIIGVHKHYFSNCSVVSVSWADPPDDTLTVLILVPVFLTLAMIALVVWCSKRSDVLG